MPLFRRPIETSACNHRRTFIENAQSLGSLGSTQGVRELNIIYYRFGNGDLWARCRWCGKTWGGSDAVRIQTTGEFVSSDFRGTPLDTEQEEAPPKQEEASMPAISVTDVSDYRKVRI